MTTTPIRETTEKISNLPITTPKPVMNFQVDKSVKIVSEQRRKPTSPVLVIKERSSEQNHNFETTKKPALQTYYEMLWQQRSQKIRAPPQRSKEKVDYFCRTMNPQLIKVPILPSYCHEGTKEKNGEWNPLLSTPKQPNLRKSKEE